jgi:hypothetical protein
VRIGARNSTPVGTSNIVTVSQKTTNSSMIIVKLLSVYGEQELLLYKKSLEGLAHFSYLNVRYGILGFSPSIM